MEISTGMFYSIMKVFEIAHVTSLWIIIFTTYTIYTQ